MGSSQLPVEPLSVDHLKSDLKGRSVRGGLVTLTSQGAQFVSQSIFTIVLARLLAPADFGLVAMVTAITGLGQSFADLGLSEATIQREDITHRQISTLFWINVGIGLGLTLCMAGLAPVLAWFYRDPRLSNITYVLSLTFLIGGLRVQHDALLKRQMRFLSLAIRDVAAYLIAVPVAIIMAWKGAGYWALIAHPLILNSTQVVLSWLMTGWLPGLPSRRANVGSLVSFGGNVAASYLIYNLNRNADNVLIGWYWGAGPLGLYSRAYNLLMLPVRQLNGPAGSVAIPAFSRLQSDPEQHARYYLRLVNVMLWVGAPVFGFLFAAAQPVIRMVLGNQWVAAAPVFQFLAIAALGQVLLDTPAWLLVSRGESARLLKLLAIVSPVIVGSFVLGLPFGIKGVALSGSLAMIGIFPWILRVAFRGTRLSLRRMGPAVVWPISVSLAGAALSEAALRLFDPSGAVPRLLVVVLSFAIICSLAALIRPVREEIRSLRKLLGHFGPIRKFT